MLELRLDAVYTGNFAQDVASVSKALGISRKLDITVKVLFMADKPNGTFIARKTSMVTVTTETEITDVHEIISDLKKAFA